MQEHKVKTTKAVVVSKGGSKSIKVAIDYVYRHPKYGKTLKRQTRLIVHDERNEAGVGDVVEVTECRPYSKTKRWRLVSILTKAAQAQLDPRAVCLVKVRSTQKKPSFSATEEDLIKLFKKAGAWA